MLFISATADLGLQGLRRQLLIWPPEATGDGALKPGDP